MRSVKDDGQLAPHMIANTTTANARTEHPDGVQAGRPHPAASTTAAVKFGKRSCADASDPGRRYRLDAAITEIARPPHGTQTRSDSDFCRASQVVERNSRASVIAGRPKSFLMDLESRYPQMSCLPALQGLDVRWIGERSG